MGRIDIYPSGSTIVPITASSLAYAQVTANQTGITTSAVALTGLSATFTVPAGRRIRVTAKADFAQTVATVNVVEMRLMEGATQLQRAKLGDPDAQSESLVLEHTISPTAGTHTYHLTAFTDAGTVTMVAAGDLPAFIHIEDVTGSQLATTPAQFVPVGQLAYAQATTDQLGITTTATDVTGLSVNVSVPSGRQIRITAYLLAYGFSASTYGELDILEDGNRITLVQNGQPAGGVAEMYATVVKSPTAGAHVYKVRMRANSGTLNIGANAQYPAYILVEDITPTPSPASGAPGSTLGYSEVTTVQGGITTETDLTGLNVNVTVPAGRRIRIATQILPASTVSTDKVRLRIKEGATVLQFGQIDPIGPTSNTMVAEAIITPSAGMHTYKVSLARDVGTGTITNNADPTFPSFILVEDITGSVWPAGQVVTTGLIAPEPWLTWNPVITQAVNVTYTNLDCKYMKIGRTVFLKMKVTITGSGTAANLIGISGLPALASIVQFQTVGVANVFDASAGQDFAGIARFQGSNSTIYFLTTTYPSGALGASGFTAGLANADQVEFMATYEAAS